MLKVNAGFWLPRAGLVKSHTYILFLPKPLDKPNIHVEYFLRLIEPRNRANWGPSWSRLVTQVLQLWDLAFDVFDLVTLVSLNGPRIRVVSLADGGLPRRLLRYNKLIAYLFATLHLVAWNGYVFLSFLYFADAPAMSDYNLLLFRPVAAFQKLLCFFFFLKIGWLLQCYYRTLAQH